MAKPTLNDTKLFVHDLLTHRAGALAKTKTWPVYEQAFSSLAAELDALPAAVLGGAPLAAQLAEADATHDGRGGAVYHYLEAVLRSPDVPAAVRDSARTLRYAFVPSLGALQIAYADEAAAAAERRALLATHEAALKSFPVPSATPGTPETLYTWVAGQIEAGEQLGALLCGRADDKPDSRRDAPRLRGAALGLATRMRATLADELASEPTLPRELDAKVFAYLDLLTAMRARGDKAATPPPPDAPAPAPSGG